MNVVIYARYSSSSQREASIEEQIKVCSEFAERKEFTITNTYSDSALSGKNDNRPALQKLLRDCERHIFDAVLVYSIDRFGRNLMQTLTNADKIEKHGIEILSATENFGNNASGKFFRNIMMSYAQYYSDDLADKIKRGMDYNAENCLCTGGNIALGYKVGKDKHFEIDTDKAPIVQMIFEMYADGKTKTEIAAYLNSMGYRTSRGSKFTVNSFYTILNNKRYIGIYTYKGEEVQGGIPRIISDELFYKVAEVMKCNKKAPARSRAKVEYLLTTKLFCGHCKEMMTGFSGTGKQGKVYNYYICNGKKVKKCDKKMVKKDYIEELVITQCRKLLTDTNINRIAKEVAAICEAERDTSNLRYLKKCLADNKRKSENALDAVLETDEPRLRERLYSKISELDMEREQIEKEIAKEEAPFYSLAEPKIKFFLTSLKKGNADDLKYRRALITMFINRIYLYDDRITITFNSGDETVTINDRLLSEIEEKDEQDKFLFINGNGPPEKKHTLSTDKGCFFSTK